MKNQDFLDKLDALVNEIQQTGSMAGDATIALRCFKNWRIQFNSVGIVRDEKSKSPGVGTLP